MKGVKKTLLSVGTGCHPFKVRLRPFKSICDMVFIFTFPTKDLAMVQATEGSKILFSIILYLWL